MDRKALHVVRGEAASGALRIALNPQGGILVQRDNLSWGPVRAESSLDQLRSERTAFWASGRREAPFDPFAQGNDLYNGLQALDAASTLVLWCGVGLEDQLLKAQLVNLLIARGLDPAAMRVVQYEYVPGTSRPAATIGFVGPDALRNHPAPVQLTTREIDAIVGCWRAFTAPTPELLMSLIGEHPRGQSRLVQALAALFRRYPDHRTGLDAWSWRLLEAATTASSERPLLAELAADSPGGLDFIQDHILLHLLHSLADPRLLHPLLQLHSDVAPITAGSIGLTPEAAAILQGRASWVELNGVDRWIGGTQLSAQNLWYAQDDYLALVRADAGPGASLQQ